MTTTVNGEAYEPRDNETILDLVTAHSGRELSNDGTPADGSRLGIAVAVDGVVVRRAQWAQTPVAGQIDIVTAVQGG
ncbi:sulfur carrier protein ThiS [Corynebacterium sp. H78]|uniref:sulfur carrier protein ThiS n=1 Tax=Corynebacterium sp. H78 TaxID=3133417 RepID=UPI0030A6DA15